MSKVVDSGNSISIYSQLLTKASQLADTGHFDEAISTYNEAISINTNHPAAHYELALLYYRNGKYDKAIYRFKLVAELNKNDVSVFNNLGVLCYKSEYWEDALQYLFKTLHLEPKHADAWYNLGRVFFKLGQMDNAASALKECLSLAPNHKLARDIIREFPQDKTRRKTVAETPSVHFKEHSLSSIKLTKRQKPLRIFAAFRNANWEDYNLQPALESFGEVIRYNWNPRFEEYESQWHWRGKQSMNSELLNFLRSSHQKEPFDVFFGYLSGRLVFPGIIRAIRMMGIPSVNICLDDKTKFYGALEPTGFVGSVDIASTFTLCWTTEKEAVKNYENVGAKAIYLPPGANHEVFHPYDIPKDIDVCFVGQKYGIRPQLMHYLKSKGIHVTIYGRGWDSGEIGTEEMVKIFSRSKIVLGIGTTGQFSDMICIKGRDFEVPMCGCLYLTQYNPDLEEFYKIGEEIVCYTSTEDLISKILYYLAHPMEAENIRQACLKRSLKEHTWVNRFEKIFKTLGLFDSYHIDKGLNTNREFSVQPGLDSFLIHKKEEFINENIIDMPFSDYILYLFAKYGHELEILKEIEKLRYNTNVFPTTGQYDMFESQVLYMIVRDVKPTNMIEFSSSSGYSTLFTALAMKKNGNGKIHSFELVPEISKIARLNVHNFGLSDYVRFTIGNVREILIPYIREYVKDVPGIVFIDSDHSCEFAQWYISNLFPILKKGTLVHIHDVFPLAANVLIDNGSRIDSVSPNGENLEIDHALNLNGYEYNRDYIYLYDLTYQNAGFLGKAKQIYPYFIPYRQGKEYVTRRMNNQGVLSEWNAALWFKYVKDIIKK